MEEQAVVAAEAVTDVAVEPKKRVRKPAPKKPEINYKALCATLEKQTQELIDQLELQQQKNEILFKREQEARSKVEELEQKQTIAINSLLQKFQMLGNDAIQLLK